MENKELALSDEELSALVRRIVSSHTDNEPFSSKEGFWASGFHPRAFSWLQQDFRFCVQNHAGPDCGFQECLNSDIEKSGVAFMGDAQLDSFAKSGHWCDFKHLRKAVLTLLYRHSFSLLGPSVNDECHPVTKLQYPTWLKEKWITNVMP